MKKSLLLAILALVLLAAGPVLAEQPVDDAQPTLAAGAEELPLFLDGAEPTLTLDATEGAVDAAKIPPPWCPYGAPTCNDDDDCDAYCGDPRFGYCFTDTHCCGCSG